jgi:hypothetical protein
MAAETKLAKEQLIKLIEQLENNPNDRIGILGDVGVTILGATGAGTAAAFFGSTIASIPLVTALTGISFGVVAAPFAAVAGAAVVGGAAIYGVSRLIKDGGFNEGKRKQLLNELNEKLKEIEINERQSNLNDREKTGFYSFLKEPLKYKLIGPDDAHQLIKSVESGHISLSAAYKLVRDLYKDTLIKSPLLLPDHTHQSKELK